MTQDDQPTNFPLAFDWWRRLVPGREFPYVCPGCSVQIGLAKRVTVSKRTCPACGTPITTKSIDQQLATLEPQRQREMSRKAKGCLALLTLAALAASTLLALL